MKETQSTFAFGFKLCGIEGDRIMGEVGCRLLERKFTGVPANYLLNKNKDISYSSFGYTEQKQRMLKEKVEELLK